MKCRAIINGKEIIGWYFGMGDSQQGLAEHYLITDKSWLHYDEDDNLSIRDSVEIDPVTAAFATGRKDKHGVEIFGSMTIDGVEFGGGDRLGFTTFDHNGIDTQHEAPVVFSYGEWAVELNDGDAKINQYSLYDDELAIIPKEEGGK